MPHTHAPDEATAPAPPTPAPHARAARLRRLLPAAITGFVLGVLLWLAAGALGIEAIPPLRNRWEWLALPVGIGAALLGLTRARRLLWAAAGLAAAGLLLIGGTPLTGFLIRRLVREDPLRPTPAVVVLASYIEQNGSLTPQAEGRLIRAYELLQGGQARELVLTRLPAPYPSYMPAVRGQLARMGMAFPVRETAPIGSTRDEAVQVANLARERGWKAILLVSDATHMRRAAAVFEKQGLTVICAPAEEVGYDLGSLNTPPARLQAFNTWLWEVVGWQIYRLRGWI